VKAFFKPLHTILMVGLLAFSGLACAKDNSALAAKHKKIIKAFPTVQHISNDAFSALEKDDVVIFDIREADEYAVSHMEGAVLISPNLPPDSFLTQYAQMTKGKTVLFYCSVGQRSSTLAHKVQTDLTLSGSGPVYNLEGGLFKWHNDKRPLVTADGKQTDHIHPYNAFWGRMVNQKDKTRYKADPDATKKD